MKKEVYSVQRIGTVISPHKNLSNIPRQPSEASGIGGKVIIEPQFVAGLQDLEGFSYIYLICFLHRVKEYQLTVTASFDNKPHGVFATRAPGRPNPISVSVVKLISRNGNVLIIENVDLLDGTPVLDIKPYVTADNINTKSLAKNL